MEEQFSAFVSGFNELIPSDHVNVFDERELELLIGGIADIDVDDWKKHTDYRGYTETDEVITNFWKVSKICESTVLQQNANRIPSASGVGMRSRNHVFCNSLLVLRAFLSMVSRTFKGATGQDDSRSRRPESPLSCQNHIHGKFSSYATPGEQS